MPWDGLPGLVARCRAGLARLGVGRGDRVVGYLPNGPEALVALLATASLGAIWASCPPELGVRSVLDRFGQLDPVVLLVVRGYRWGAKEVGRTAEGDAVAAALPSVRHVVDVDAGWDDLPAAPDDVPLGFEPVPFDHPLYVLFSSGTTGPPKAIVHGHGASWSSTSRPSASTTTSAPARCSAGTRPPAAARSFDAAGGTS